jgi:protease-4
MKRLPDALQRGPASYALLALLGVVIGALLVPPAVGAVAGPDGTVAVVTLDEPITGSIADQTIQELRDVRRNDSVDAVVLRVDSGGGSVTGSEAQYRAVKRLEQTKPVVTSIRTVAASGAYYTILPSDTIYAEPSSMVGHVGVIGMFTGSDGVPAPMTSGPDKATGGTIDQFRAQLETLKQSFVQTALDERGEEIDLSRTEISQAKIYIGARAVQNGYADEIGGLETAIDSAASSAGLSSYQVVERNPARAPMPTLSLGGSNATQTTGALFGAPGMGRVKYLAFWGQPAGNSTEVITNVSS